MPSKIGSWTRRVNNGRFVGRGGVKNEEPTFRVAVEVDNFQLPDNREFAGKTGRSSRRRVESPVY
jgi:hypothetical protein